MRKDITICTCDRCGYTFEIDDVDKIIMEFKTDKEKEQFYNRERLHEVNGYELCDKCYKNYKTVIKNFMEVGKE